jgi:hypothetical protein
MGYNQANAASILNPSTLKTKLMKRIIILLAFLTIGSLSLLAQAPPPPPGTGNNGGSNGFVGGTNGGAPMGNGTFILLTLAAAYAGRKVYIIKASETGE